MILVELLVFEHVDLLDVGGPYEVLLTANRLARRAQRAEPFALTTVGAGVAPVRAYGGLRIIPDRAVGDEGCDVLVVPGAVDVGAVVADGTSVPAIARAAAGAGLLASVCTGSLLLGEAGLLDGAGGATTHHEDLAALGAYLDPTRVIGGVAWVDAGTLVTAGGLANGLGMALHLVHRLVDRPLADAVAASIDVRWSPGDGVTVPGASRPH